jgi:hypothetical protein
MDSFKATRRHSLSCVASSSTWGLRACCTAVRGIGCCENDGCLFGLCRRHTHTHTRHLTPLCVEQAMRVQVTLDRRNTIALDVDGDMTVADLLALTACELDVDLETVEVAFNGHNLKLHQPKTLHEMGFTAANASVAVTSAAFNRAAPTAPTTPPAQLTGTSAVLSLVSSLGSSIVVPNAEQLKAQREAQRMQGS